MIINFRQGIVSYPTTGGVQQFLTSTGNYVSINTSVGQTDVAVAHRTANYLHTESSNVPNAWGPFTTGDIVWLYWDFDTLTAVRSFGFTSSRPVAQPTAPALPVTDQHWFDTSTNVTKVWNGLRWQEKIRVLSAEYDPTNHTFTSVSIFSNQGRFDGTQTGIQGTSTATGRIIVDNTGLPVVNQYGLFFTTEDDFFINGSPITTIRLESNVLTARPVENIAAYHVVKFSDFGKVSLASYDDSQSSVIAIAVQDTLRDDTGSFVIQGTVTNPAWNWTTVGAPLWVLETGMLVDEDPHTTDAVTYNVGKAPIARVISQTSIIFDQGLGGKGDKGDSALAGVNEMATMDILGKVKISHVPADIGSPIAVETTDPRMSDARVPLQHEQPASSIIPDAYGTNVNGNLQTTLTNLESAKLNKTGDQMTGTLLLNGNPTLALAAVPKQYADTFIPLNTRGQAGGVATLGADGYIPSTQLPKIALTNTYVVPQSGAVGTPEEQMLALAAQTGDLAVRTDVNATFILKGAAANNILDWQELLTKPDGVVWVDVKKADGQHGLTVATDNGSISGTPGVTSSGTFTISLANDLLALENLGSSLAAPTTGIAHRTGPDTWELKAVDLTVGGNGVSGVLSMSNGGTGLSTVNGYIKGNGTVFTASTTIPGVDVSGPVPSASSVDWVGVTNRPSNLSGYGITDAYSITQTNALTWNWSSIVSKPSTLFGYGITDVYSKTEVDTALLQKANNATTLSGYGITDASHTSHTHTLASLTDVNTTVKSNGDVLAWNGSNWSPLTVGNAVLPTVFSGKTFDVTNDYTMRDNAFVVVDNLDVTKRFTFQAGNIAPATTRVYTLPNEDGQLAVTNGFGAFGNWNINAASADTVVWSGVTSHPATMAGYGITDSYTKTQTDTLTWNWSAITSKPSTLIGYGIVDAYTKPEVNALTWNWSAITNKPTTAAGYGITNVYTKTETNALLWDWSAITTGKPTTLAGYGITDAASSTHNHDASYIKPSDVGDTVAGLDFTGKVPETQLPAFVRTHTYTANNDAGMLSLPATQGDLVIRTDVSKTFVLMIEPASVFDNWVQIVTPAGGNGTVTSIAIAPPIAGIAITGGPIASAGTFAVELADDLAGLEALTGTGYVRRTGSNTYDTTTTVTSADISGQVAIANGGTGASSAATALLNLGGVPLTGGGASGDWNINVTGNAATVTDGVYTTQTYANPTWISSLAPEKVVSTWNGSTNISTVASSVNFGDFVHSVNGIVTISSVAPTLVHSFDTLINSGGKYLIHVNCAAQQTASMVELYVTTDALGNVHISQTTTGSNDANFTAELSATTVVISVTAPTADITTYRYSATLFTTV